MCLSFIPLLFQFHSTLVSVPFSARFSSIRCVFQFHSTPVSVPSNSCFSSIQLLFQFHSTPVSVPFNTWATWVLSLEKGLKEHPELSVHVVHYEQLKTVSLSLCFECFLSLVQSHLYLCNEMNISLCLCKCSGLS